MPSANAMLVTATMKTGMPRTSRILLSSPSGVQTTRDRFLTARQPKNGGEDDQAGGRPAAHVDPRLLAATIGWITISEPQGRGR
jgi:hypothetical protein